MNIIKHGKLPEEKSTTKRFECANCGCVFEANKGEYKGASQYNDFIFIVNVPNVSTHLMATREMNKEGNKDE